MREEIRKTKEGRLYRHGESPPRADPSLEEGDRGAGREGVGGGGGDYVV